MEHDSYRDPSHPLRALVLGSKTYTLYCRSARGAVDGEQVEIVDPKEIGLRGAYLDPPGVEWIRGLWTAVVRFAEDGEPDWYALARHRCGPNPQPADLAEEQHRAYGDWSRLPAVGVLPISRPRVAATLRAVERSSGVRIRPFTFLLRTSATGGLFARAADAPMLVAPYTADPAEWGSERGWWNVRTGELEPEGRYVKSLRDVAEVHGMTEDSAFLGPDPKAVFSRGLLQRRPAVSSPSLLVQIGKEGGQVAERVAGTVRNADAVAVVAAPDDWTELVVPVLRHMGVAEAMRRSGLPLNDRFSRYLAGTMQPKGRRRAALRAAALEHAKERLTDPEAAWSWDERAILAHAASVAAQEKKARRCACGCGAAPLGRSKWAGEACRKRAVRERAGATVGPPGANG